MKNLEREKFMKKLLQNIFSVGNIYRNGKKFKVITIAGFRIKKKIFKPIKSIYNRTTIPAEGIQYVGNPEIWLSNIEVKQELLKTGRSFEHEDMVIANKTIGKYFLHNVKHVVNIGSGVGTFEWNNAPKHPDIKFVASEFDEKSTQWVLENRKLENVIYCTDNIPTLLNKYGKFDLAITVDVIEHIQDYKSFLDEFSLLADKAVISTPNRDRYKNIQSLISPPYKWHVEEFNAGELYFILKMYYKNVTLYSLKNPYIEELTEVGLYSDYEKLVAYCEK